MSKQTIQMNAQMENPVNQTEHLRICYCRSLSRGPASLVPGRGFTLASAATAFVIATAVRRPLQDGQFTIGARDVGRLEVVVSRLVDVSTRRSGCNLWHRGTATLLLSTQTTTSCILVTVRTYVQ